MTSSSNDEGVDRRAKLARQRTVQGYVSLAILTAICALAVARQRIPGLLYYASVWTLGLAGLMLSFDGVRYGRGGGRVAAWFVLVVLSMMALLAIVGSLNGGP